MRVAFYGTMLILFATSMAAAQQQDSNFANGPQYLMTAGSSQFARSIATPSLSLSGPPLQVGASDATGLLTAGAAADFQAPPLTVALPQVDLFPVFYGDRPVSAPTGEITISFPAGTSAGLTSTLPPSISEDGIGQFTTVEALHERGYGATLAEVSSSLKRHASPARRVYNNEDIERLRGGS